MPEDIDPNIERIVRIANRDVCDAISSKIGRALTSDESNAISTFIGTEYFWARAEELSMFVQHRSAEEVTATAVMSATRFREGTLVFQEGSREATKRVIHCNMCKATGDCYCIRQGPRTAVGCPRCGGTAKCRHCNGTGTR